MTVTKIEWDIEKRGIFWQASANEYRRSAFYLTAEKAFFGASLGYLFRTLTRRGLQRKMDRYERKTIGR
jgi:hypothetical protein